jgi:hypothetical protein
MLLRQYSDADEALMRSIVLPEEDRVRVTNTPWVGGYRWYRAPNVICLEQYRRPDLRPDARRALG